MGSWYHYSNSGSTTEKWRKAEITRNKLVRKTAERLGKKLRLFKVLVHTLV